MVWSFTRSLRPTRKEASAAVVSRKPAIEVEPIGARMIFTRTRPAQVARALEPSRRHARHVAGPTAGQPDVFVPNLSPASEGKARVAHCLRVARKNLPVGQRSAWRCHNLLALRYEPLAARARAGLLGPLRDRQQHVGQTSRFGRMIGVLDHDQLRLAEGPTHLMQ